MERERKQNGGDYCTVDCSALMVPSSPPDGGGGGGGGYIQHPVSKFDTLPGVAIRYGVEVADIKRMNGLVSDLQMFARKTLQIPSPGRHPPSPIVSNGQGVQGPSSSEQNPLSRRHSDLFGSFQSLKLKSSPWPKVSPAVSCLQGYYDPKPADQKVASEGFEMAVYQKGVSHNLEDEPIVQSTPHSKSPLGLHRKCKSVANDMSENGDLGRFLSQDSNGSDRRFERRRRQKSETDFSSRTPEVLLKEDNSSGSGFSALGGKGLALRPKSAGRTLSAPDNDSSPPMNPALIGLNDSFLNDSASAVRKSSSTPSFQDPDSGALSSLWPTARWNLKPDFQAISTAAITKPIFDSLPKQISARKSKTAVD